MFKNVDWNTLYSFVFTVGGIITALGVVARHFVHRFIEEHMRELKETVNSIKEEICKDLDPLDKRLDRIEYALYNDGKTGLVNKVDSLVENQQSIKTDVEVLKARIEAA